MNELAEFDVTENIVLEKFDGDPHPDNLVERVHLTDGVVTKHEFFEPGSTEPTAVFTKEVNN